MTKQGIHIGEVTTVEKTILRPQAELRYQEELAALRLWDRDNRKPQNWQLSPKAVRLFILGSPRPVPCGGREIASAKNIWATTPWWSAASSPWRATGA